MTTTLVSAEQEALRLDEEDVLAPFRERFCLPLGDSDELAPGELVFAFGAPFGARLAAFVTFRMVCAGSRPAHPASKASFLNVPFCWLIHRKFSR